jgi:[FeFe] hydrogenase H-cluster maturation GTPase HydF
MIIDTPGIDDKGALGELRVGKSRQVLNKTDVAVLVIDSACGKTKEDEELIRIFGEKKINYIVAYNKSDLIEQETSKNDNEIHVSAKTGYNIEKLKEKIAASAVMEDPKLKIVGDLINPSDFVVLVTPIDKAAPKGRLILPQQQTIRDILEADAVAIVVKEHELRETLETLGKKPKLVITDSQVFSKVSADTPKEIPLTSFSILFARYKGSLETAVKGAKTLESLQDGDTVLISEGCTHHRQCDDIGTVKLPRWIKNYTQKQISFQFTSGTEFPDDLSEYQLIVHCGGCMLNEREMVYRKKCAEDQHVPFTNYGILIAYMQGILKRSVAMFPNILAEIEE